MKYVDLYKNITYMKGPILIVENVSDVHIGYLAKIILPDGSYKRGQVLQVNEDKAVIQVFEGTGDLNTKDIGVNFSAEPFRVEISEKYRGRILDAFGNPKDGLKREKSGIFRDVNSSSINPYYREYPHDFIETGISSIDGLTTLIRGQKLPVFSGSGLPHYEMAIEIAKNARLKEENDNFIVIFVAMGIKNDDAFKFYRSFESDNKLDKVILFFNLADDPPMERLIIPRTALTYAEYLAFEKDYQVLVILSDMTNYCEALREISSARSEVPSRKGYPGYLYSDLASIYERAGRIKGKKGSISQIPILTMPSDDITHPIPDLTGYITEGQIVLSRDLNIKGVYPPVDILPSLSRLMKDAIGKGFTREDHPHLAAQINAAYSYAKKVKVIASVIGEEELSEVDQTYLKFSNELENTFIDQGINHPHTMDETLDLMWKILKILPKTELTKLSEEELKKYYG